MAVPGQPITEPLISALEPNPPTRTVATRAPLTLTNGNLVVTVDPDTSYVTATRVSDRKTLLRQTGLSFQAAQAGSRPGSAAVVVEFAGTDGEQVYGLGEHKDNKIQQAPYKKVFADSLYYGKSQGGDVSIPYYASSLGYCFLWNSPSLGSVDISSNAIQWVSNATLGVDFWMSTTPADQDPSESIYASLLHQYVDAVGHPTTLPHYSTGFIQCKDRYRNQTQLLAVAHGYKSRGLPISMIVIDWFHWVNMGDWGLNPACWPDPQGMVDELKSLGIELMVTTWPFMGQNVSTHWQEYLDNKYLATSTKDGYPDSFWRYATPTGNALVDATNDEARNATWKHWMEGYGKYGIQNVWLDETEPDHARYISGGQWKFAKGLDSEVIMGWVWEWTRMFKGQFDPAHDNPASKPFMFSQDGFASIGKQPGDYMLLTRSAWAGTPKHGHAMWSGDISSSWGSLATAVVAGQGAGLSGVPIWTTDIGGYAGGDPSDPSFQELVVRWFQFGALSPLFRLHGHRKGGPPANQCGPTNGDNEVWNLAQEPSHYAAVTAAMHFRETIRDYVASLQATSAATGMPMMRAMILAFPNDPVCTGNQAENQFMFGDDWLVAPVTTQSVSSWAVYLPKILNNHWVYWWNSSAVDGGQWVHTNTANLTEFPLFKR
eukprot:gene1938-2982_t